MYVYYVVVVIWCYMKAYMSGHIGEIQLLIRKQLRPHHWWGVWLRLILNFNDEWWPLDEERVCRLQKLCLLHHLGTLLNFRVLLPWSKASTTKNISSILCSQLFPSQALPANSNNSLGFLFFVVTNIFLVSVFPYFSFWALSLSVLCWF